jgi:tetratricopeptide (TPR) repeat protein
MTDDSAVLLRRAVGLQQQGNLAAAEAIYRRILNDDPSNTNALHLLGLVALRCGRPEEAIRLIRQAITAVPDQPQFHSNLGAAQRAAGQPEDALHSYDRAIALKSDYAEAHNNRGIALEQLGRPREAVACYDRAIALRPDYAEAFYNRGNARRALERHAQALASYDRAIALQPGYAEALNNRGDLLLILGRYQDALDSLDAALAFRPDYVDALYNRGNVLQKLNRFDEALIAYNRAIALRPGYGEALNNRGTLFLALNRHEEALASCDQAIAVRPDWPDPLCNRGVALQVVGRHEEAVECFDRALALQPDSAEVHANRSMSRLALGDFEAGWKEYEWRWKTVMVRDLVRRFRAQRWLDQTNIDGRTILLHAEQGFGDTLQFCRYVPMVSARAKVVLEVPPRLCRLLATLDGGATIIGQGEKLPPFDLHCPLLSLPLAFGTTLATIPATVPYLRADLRETEAWSQRLKALPGLRVGIAWAGGLRPYEPLLRAIDLRRSITLGHFAPLTALPGVSLISLQKGEPASQTRMPPSGMVIHDWTEELEDFADTAALVAALDLVITVDTAVAHLAGALGKNVWILNRFDACWRWLPGREDSPWYPTARLFRQSVPGDWDSVIAAVRDALRALNLSPGAR